MTTRDSHRVYRAGVLGCTGVVGQRFVSLLANHPCFKLTFLAASAKSAGREYKDVVQWRLAEELPSRAASMTINTCDAKLARANCDLVFSALGADVAGDIETAMASEGLAVFSNARNHRMAPDVPILIPYVNEDHLGVIKEQRTYSKCRGFIVTNANCAATGISVALKPLMHLYGGIKRINVVTLQAISGAGYPGVPALDITDNVVPFIEGEEEKIAAELRKILGSIVEEGRATSRIDEAAFTVSATCNRVPVTDGHTACVSVEFNEDADRSEICTKAKEALGGFGSLGGRVGRLPSCPERIIDLREERDRPQPRLDRMRGGGLSVAVGRVRVCPLFHIKMTVLSHNSLLGAAGGSLLNAELAVSQNRITPPQ